MSRPWVQGGRLRRRVPTYDRSIHTSLPFPIVRCNYLQPATRGCHLPPGNEEPPLGQHAVLPLPQDNPGLPHLTNDQPVATRRP